MNPNLNYGPLCENQNYVGRYILERTEDGYFFTVTVSNKTRKGSRLTRSSTMLNATYLEALAAAESTVSDLLNSPA